MVVATKVGMLAGREGLGADNVRQAAEESLRRLGTDRIDLYYAHRDDPDTPLKETLGAFDTLVRDGKVRYVAASNHEAPRLAEALEVSAREGLASYVALQPRYNLADREGYGGELQAACAGHGVACLPYYGLANGFLTGKYRPGGPPVESVRAEAAGKLLDERGIAILAALDEIAAARRTTVAALAWLLAQPTVAAPIASARTPEQLAELLPVAGLDLGAAQLERLTAAGR